MARKSGKKRRRGGKKHHKQMKKNKNYTIKYPANIVPKNGAATATSTNVSKQKTLSRKERKAKRQQRHKIIDGSHKVQRMLLCSCTGINPYTCKKDHGSTQKYVWCCALKHKLCKVN